MSLQPSWRRGAALMACTALAGCASLPGKGEVVTAAATPVTARDVERMRPLQRDKLREAGVTAEGIDAGRLVRVACAVMADGWWSGLALLRPGSPAAGAAVVTVRVQDPGSNDYEGINEVLGPADPRLQSGLQAYRVIPDWRERGLRNNVEPVELPRETRDRYRVVQGSYLVRCSPGA